MVVLYRCVCTRNYAEWRASWHQQEKTQDSSTQLVLETLPLVLEGHTQEVECIATDGNTIASTCLAGHIRVWDSITGEIVAHVDRKKFFNSVPGDLMNRTPDPDELMSDYESGSPPSRGEMETCNSYVLSNSSPASHRQKSSPTSAGYRPITQTTTNKRHSMNSLYNDYQIQEFSPDKRPIVLRRSLDQTFELPDLRSSINTRFTSMKYSSGQTNYEQGFDYGQRYRHLFEEHRKSIEDVKKCESTEGLSISSGKFNANELSDSANSLNTFKTSANHQNPSPIWCVDYQDNLIVVGCANGSLEFWEGTTGRFKVSLSNVDFLFFIFYYFIIYKFNF